MSQDMSTFYTGVRRNQPERVPRARPAVKAGATPGGGGAAAARGAGTASRNRWPQSGAGVGAATGAIAAGAASRAAGNRRRPLTTRLTGGGPGPTGDPQSTSTPPAMPPAGNTPGTPRRLREIEWIMKPSKSFIQCSESSSEDSFPDRAPNFEKLHDKTGRRRSSWSSGISSSSREKSQSAHPTQQLANLLKSSCQPTEESVRSQVRTKKRSSRVFCVPDQRIMHSEELLQAQMLQMRPRKAKSPLRYSPCPAPTPSFIQGSPSISSNQASEAVLLHSSATVTLLQPENSYVLPPTGLIPCSCSCSPSPKSSQAPVQPPPSRSHSPCSFEKVQSSSSSSSSSCPSQTLVTEPAAGSNSSSKDSSLSTSGTECSAERVVQRYCGTAGGSKAIKLTSTVIKIMPEKAKTPQRASKGKVGQQSRSKLRSKPTSVFFRKGTKDPAINLAMNAPMIQSIAPPIIMPKVKVSKPIVSQSVNLVANQLTAQLKKAVGEDHKPVRANHKPVKKDLGKATAEKGAARKLVRKTSIYLLMDQAKPEQAKARDEPLPARRKNDWVIQPMEQQMISAATDQPKKDNRNLSGSERLNSNTSDSNNNNSSKVEHNYDKYLKTTKDQGVSGGDRYIPEPIPFQNPPKGNQSKKQPVSQISLKPDSSRIPAGNILRNRSKPQQKSPYSIRSRPVSLNRIPRPRVPPVPSPQQQPRQVQPVEVEVVTGTCGKIVHKAQHKVPRTMEDGIDMSYQYFVSLPLKRGRKPQVVRYLYRPMVRHLNGLPNRRRSSKRGKSRKAAAAAAATAVPVPVPAEQPPELHPALVALGGGPLPLEDPPLDEEETPEQPEIGSTLIFDPEAALNSPYNVPPLKLKPRYMPMLEKLDQMPYPDERLLTRRRRQRRVRAAGGSEQLPAMEYDVLSLESSGGGDVIAKKDQKHRMPVIVWSGRQTSPGQRTSVVDYESKPTRLGTTTGASIMYHQPLRLTRRDGNSRPMIRTITYETIEREELEEQEKKQQLELRQEKEQLESEQLAKEQMDRMKLEQEQEEQEQQEQEEHEQEQQEQKQEKPMEMGQESISMAKSVSFHLEPVFVSRGSTSAFQSSSSSSSNVASKGKSKKRKSKKSHAKGKGKAKNRSKGKGKGRK